MVFLGLIVMTLMQLIAALVMNKAYKVRMSGASIIASMALSWPTTMMFMVCLTYAGILLTVPENKWVVASFMLIPMATFMGWLWAFQPETIEQLSLKKLKKLELEKNKLLLDFAVNKWKEMKKSKTGNIAEIETEIALIREERMVIQNKFRRFKPVSEWFKKDGSAKSDLT